MQDQLNEKSVTLIVQANKLSARLLMKALKKLLAEMKKVEKGLTTPKTYKGNHDELMKTAGFYAELYNSQFELAS